MKKTVLGKLAFMMICITLIASCSSTRKSIGIESGWELLGETKVNFVRDIDEIPVISGNLFTAIRFRVEDKDVRISYIKIHYKNGDKLEPQVDETIGADQNSRVIELAAEGKAIDKIEFKFKTLGSIFKGRANVIVFGKRYTPYGY